MSSSQFLQIHFLTSYPAALLNRDDAGFAKRMPFGGASRIRVSSQCLKRHWRTFDGKGALSEISGAEASIRSRMTFDQQVLRPLVESGVDEQHATLIVTALMENVLGQSVKAAKKAADDAEQKLQTGQLTVLGRPELDFLLDVAKTLAAEIPADSKPADAKKLTKKFFSDNKNEQKKNLQTLTAGSGLDAAMFGRMVTSDILAREDAAVQVAHAMTVHGEQSEPDYFTAVDDLLGADGDGSDLGSAHLGTTELTSGIFYGYINVDLPLLVSNIQGVTRKEWAAADMSIAREVLRRLPRLVGTVSPGAKKGSTAPYSYANFILLESGNQQPRSLANAFLEPISLVGDPIANSYTALARHLGQLDRMYGAEWNRIGAALGNFDVLNDHVAGWGTVDELGNWAADQLGA